MRVSRILFPFILFASSCSNEPPPDPGPPPCSAEWQQNIEARFPTGDGAGHGPDVGSQEWRSVVEFKMGIRDNPANPPLESDEWCAYIDAQVRKIGT